MAMKKGTKQILLISGLGVGGYLAYRWLQGRQAAEVEPTMFLPSRAVGGGGFGSILWGGGGLVCPKGEDNDGTPDEEPTVTPDGEQITAQGETPMGTRYRILASGESEIFNPYTETWDPIWWPGPAYEVKESRKAPYGELSAELSRWAEYTRTGKVSPPYPRTPTPSFEPVVPTPGVLGGLTGTTPMGTAYRLESLERGAPAHIYNPFTADKYGLGGWEKIAYPTFAPSKAAGYGEPSAQAARAREYTRAADAARAAAARSAAQVIRKQPGLRPYGEPSAQAARAASAAAAAVARVTEQARVGAARAAAGQIAYPTFAPSTASQALIARVPMAGGGHL